MPEALLAAVSAAVGFVIKAWWDTVFQRRRDRESVALQRRVDHLERQLSEFYWPLRLALDIDKTLWRQVDQLRNQDDAIQRAVSRTLEEDVILPNHGLALDIIRGGMHLALPDDDLRTLLVQYTRHVVFHSAIREAANQAEVERALLAMGVEWPRELLAVVREHSDRLQASYDALIERESDRVSG